MKLDIFHVYWQFNSFFGKVASLDVHFFKSTAYYFTDYNLYMLVQCSLLHIFFTSWFMFLLFMVSFDEKFFFIWIVKFFLYELFNALFNSPGIDFFFFLCMVQGRNSFLKQKHKVSIIYKRRTFKGNVLYFPYLKTLLPIQNLLLIRDKQIFMYLV